MGPPGPLVPSITSWTWGPVKICKPDQIQHTETILHEISSPPSKIYKADDSSIGKATAKIVNGFNIEQSFRRLSCDESINTKNSNLNEKLSSKKEVNDPSIVKLVLLKESEILKNNKNENPWIKVG